MARILFSGDFAPGNYKFAPSIFIGIEELLNDHDLHVSNIENPIADIKSPICKTGPALLGPLRSVEFFLAARVDIACLANNHIFDHGERGLISTITQLTDNRISVIGVTNTSEPPNLSLALHDTTISMVNYCEHEFSVRPGSGISANGFEYEKAFSDISLLRPKSDLIFCIYHGGNEYYDLPSPGFKKRMRYLVDIGFDAVICHHTHVISGFEIYRSKPIVYGLGNFYFPLADEPDSWYRGMLLSIDTENLQSPQFHFIEQSRDFSRVSILEGDDREKEFSNFRNLTEIIKDDASLINEWKKFVGTRKYALTKSLINPGKLSRILLRLGILDKEFGAKKKHLLAMMNMIRCQAHNDLLVSALEDLIINEVREES